MSTLCAGGRINAMVLKIGSFVELWMDLDAVTQSEVKSEREKQISHIKTHMWNLEKQYRYLICKVEVETQTQRTSVWIPRGSGVGRIGRLGLTYIHTTDTMNKTENNKMMRVMRTSWVPHGSLLTPCSDQNGKGIQKTGDMCLRMADSLCCSADTNSAL